MYLIVLLQVVFLLLLSIFGPQYLGALRTLVSNPPEKCDWRAIFLSVGNVLIAPLHMYIGNLKMAYLELKSKCQPSQSLTVEKEDLKRALNCHVKLELGLETIYQLCGQLILLFLAYTETPTQDGLKMIFHEGLDPLSLTLLAFSIMLSFYSCVASHWKALTACREHFPFKSRMIASFYSLCGCLTRVLVIVMFFAVPLGLFNLLRHLQAEQYPWHPNVLDLVSDNNTLTIGDNLPIEWNQLNRWKVANSLYQENEDGTLIMDIFGQYIPDPGYFISPPDYTLYAGVQLKYYLIIFMAHFGLHMFFIYLAKTKLSKTFANDLNLLEKFIHCIENTNIVYNTKEWDDDKGNANDHKERMKSNWKEVLITILIKMFFNSLLLIPLTYLGNYTI